MQQYLHKFLILHHSLQIPQLGSFYVRDEAARPDPASGLLFAPRPVISFHPQADQPANRLFFTFLASEMNTDEVSAVRQFHDFCYKFREQLHQQEMAILPGVGRIVRGADEKLLFTPEDSLLELLPPVSLSAAAEISAMPKETRKQQKKKKEVVIPPEETIEPAAIEVIAEVKEEEKEIVTEEEEVETLETKDRWRLYAVILLLLGILGLLFYYQ